MNMEVGGLGKGRRGEAADGAFCRDVGSVLDRLYAVAEFSPDGILTRANQHLLDEMGCVLETVVG